MLTICLVDIQLCIRLLFWVDINNAKGFLRKPQHLIMKNKPENLIMKSKPQTWQMQRILN